jgi:hypothetical protein
MATTPIPDSASVVVSRELLTTDFGGELVLLNLRDGVYYSLEDVGIRIWQLLRDPVSVAAIRDTLVSEYDVDPARCERDIQRFLGQLAGRGLIEVRERP